MKVKKTLLFIILLLIAIALGSFLGSIFEKTTGGLSWLAYSVDYSLSPTTLDLTIFSLTFGITLSINVAQIFLIVAAFILYPKISKILLSE
jgi:hypothetical protein